MTEIFGMHWTLAVTLICVVMMTVDLFLFQGGGLTFITDILFTVVILHFIPIENLIWKTFCGVFLFAVILAVHWFVYRKIVLQFVNRVIAPEKRCSNNDLLIGKTGKICWIEERIYIYVADEHHPCVLENEDSAPELAGLKAEITAWNNAGELVVKVLR